MSTLFFEGGVGGVVTVRWRVGLRLLTKFFCCCSFVSFQFSWWSEHFPPFIFFFLLLPSCVGIREALLFSDFEGKREEAPLEFPQEFDVDSSGKRDEEIKMRRPNIEVCAKRKQ